MYPYRFMRGCILAVVLAALNSCAVGYYWQAGMGQLRISRGKAPVAELLQEGTLSEPEQQRLMLSQDALDFAHEVLLLPDNGSYRTYYDTGERYVVWNVFAAPEFSLEPRKWCFPITGCISYRGYFSEDAARKYAAKLAAAGDDVYVGGVTAYSTLGRLRDPLLNTMLSMSSDRLVGLLFHELAHQRLYVQDDSAFNEGFASAVEDEGLRRWRARSGEVPGWSLSDQQRSDVLDLLRDVRAGLDAVYGSVAPAAAKRVAKQQVLDDLAERYSQLVGVWEAGGLQARPYASLIEGGLNNASLSAIATYDNYVPAFTELLRECDGDFDCFYARADEIGGLDADARQVRMRELDAAAKAGDVQH